MRSLAAASTIPVTNKVAHAKSRTSFRILAMTAPLHYCPTRCRRFPERPPHDGDTSNPAPNARRFDWFPTPRIFLMPYVSVLFPTRGGVPQM